VEANICQWGNVDIRWYHQRLINRTDSPIHDTDQDLQRRAAERECVLNQEEFRGKREVCEESDDKCRVGDGEAQDCEVLPVPTVGVVYHGREVDEVFVREGEGDYAGEVNGCRDTARGRGEPLQRVVGRESL